MRICQPMASREKILACIFHHKVDGADAVVHTYVAAAIVLPRVERETGVMIVVERAEALVLRYLHSQSLCDLLYWKVAELLNFIFFHTKVFFYFFKYSCVLV